MIKHTDMYYYDLIRKNIKKFRIEKGYTQQRLSEKLLIFLKNKNKNKHINM